MPTVYMPYAMLPYTYICKHMQSTIAIVAPNTDRHKNCKISEYCMQEMISQTMQNSESRFNMIRKSPTVIKKWTMYELEGRSKHEIRQRYATHN